MTSSTSPDSSSQFAFRFAGGAFVAAAMMLWFGWWLMPVRIGTYFEPDIFGQIREQLHYWIWVYRVHLFGMIVTVIALVGLAALFAGSPARVLIWPGVAVAAAGMLVSALGAAFYYHHGAWGAIDLAERPADAAQTLVGSLRLDTEYITCLVRFGRVFGGLGLVVLAWGLLRWNLLPRWIGLAAALIGIAAMALTMGLPDHLSYYLPIFHAHAVWLAAVGVLLWRSAPGETVRAQTVPAVT